MKPSSINRICAHPVVISWIAGAAALNVLAMTFAVWDASISSLVADSKTMLLVAFTAIPLTLLGYFLGMFTFWPLVRRLCVRHNAASVNVSDEVVVLAGRDRGTCTKVYEMTVGQGGWKLARLELGQERRGSFTDLFEPYSLLVTRRQSDQESPA